MANRRHPCNNQDRLARPGCSDAREDDANCNDADLERRDEFQRLDGRSSRRLRYRGRLSSDGGVLVEYMKRRYRNHDSDDPCRGPPRQSALNRYARIRASWFSCTYLSFVSVHITLDVSGAGRATSG